MFADTPHERTTLPNEVIEPLVLADRRRPERMMAKRSKPLPLAETLGEFAGSWVAVDRHTGRAVAAADTPYALSAEIRERGLKDVAIIRAPDDNEPELVGLG